MARTWDLTGDDVVQWSKKYDAPGLLPDLVRRLLLATSPISSITMSAQAGGRLRDWDGVVRSSATTPFCPAGLSLWELTVEDDKGKLTEDFRKRSRDLGSFDPATTTYVAVSARRISGHVRWAEDRNAERTWKEVRLLHADDLAAWLATAPAVARWFAEKIGHPAADGIDVSTFLDVWRARTRIRLPVEIVLAGERRQRLAEGVRAWARSAGRDARPLRVYADTWDEAAVFVAATLEGDQSPEGHQVLARTIVVASEGALRSALHAQAAEPLVVIAALPEAAVDIGPVVLALEGAPPSIASDIVSLSPIPHLRFAKVLVDAGMSPSEADRLAKGSGGQVSALLQLLGYVSPPAWASDASPIALAAMLLVGSFEPGNSEDREALSLLGADPREVELLCERLRLSPGAPTHKEESRGGRSVWTWRAPANAWATLVSRIPASVLGEFQSVAVLVLSERDPGLDLLPEQRFSAAIHGKVLRASQALRDGLARSLIRLSLNDDGLKALHGPLRGSTIAASVVQDVLTPDWQVWASASRLLPLMTEAAPRAFLDAIEASLRAGDTGVVQLLGQETRMGANPHVPLLWALETLGWDPVLLPRVAFALATLARHDIAADKPGKVANRPARSLENLFRIALWQTNAGTEERIAEIRRRLADETTAPVMFSLLVAQVGAIPNLLGQSRKPEIWPIVVPSLDEQAALTQREGGRVLSAYLELAIEHAGTHADRWAELLRRVRMTSEHGAAFLDRLEQVNSQIADDRADLWSALRHVLHTTFFRPGESEASHATWSRWKALYDARRPREMVLCHGWLFERRVELPRPFDPERDLVAEIDEIDKLRVEAVEEIGRCTNPLPILVDLTKAAEDKSALGKAIGAASIAETMDAHILGAVPIAALTPLLPAFLASRSADVAWIQAKLREMVEHGRQGDVVTVLVAFGTQPAVWRMSAALGDDIRRSYWRQVPRVLGQHSPEDWEYAIESLLEVGNTAVAAQSAEWAKENVSIETVARALHALLADPSESRCFFREPTGSYTLEQLMERLSKASDSTGRFDELLTSAELAYALGTFEPRRPTRHLSAAFAATPDHFIELVKRIYRAEGESAEARSPEEQEQASERAHSAYSLLEAWKGYPGEGRSSDEKEESLYAWCLRSLRELAAAGRADVGASEVARVLARAGPAADDGIWPCIASRKLIEAGEFPALRRALILAQRNRRGPTIRGLEHRTG